jgi:hypothetical protein
MSEANKVQHGGAHYQGGYQHWDLVADLQLNYYTANATKYVSRHRKKNGREDLLKAQHYLNKYLELISQGRMPQPLTYPDYITIGREQLVLKFLDANSIEDPEEIEFFQDTCNSLDTESLRSAVSSLQRLLDRTMPQATAKGGMSVPAHIAAAINTQFAPEGYWGDMRVLWKCRSCGKYFQALDGTPPWDVHACPGSEPTRAYVDQG